MSEETPARGQGDSTDSKGPLVDPHHARADIALVGRAVRERWAVPKTLQEAVLTRLQNVVERTAVTQMTADGPVSVEAPADGNAVRAAAVIVSMTKQNQDDDHLADKNARLDAGQATERIAMEPVITRRPVVPPCKP